jgi:hypothetical protein
MTTLHADYRDPQLETRLQGAWRREQTCHLVSGIGEALAWAGGIALVALALDWLIDLPGLVRTGILATMVVIAAWRGYRRSWRLLRAFRPRQVSLKIERTYPDLNSLLVSYIDFTHAAPEPGTSQALRDHVCRRAAAEVRPLDFGRIAPADRLRAGLIAAAIVVLLFAALGLAYPRLMGVFAARLVNPMSTAVYPTDTIIVMISGAQNVREGGSVTLAARAEGERPATGVLRVRSEGRDWEKIPLDADAQGVFSREFREVYREFEYQFDLGDATSPVFPVRVVAAPRIVNATVTITPPDYMRQEPEQRQSLTLTAAENATVHWALRLDKPVSDAQFIPEHGEPIAMKRLAGGRTVEVQTTARASIAYRFAWRDQEYEFDHDGPKHYLQVVLDHPPQVRIDYPSDNQKGVLDKTLSVTFTAQDDHGVAAATLVHRRNETQPVRTPLGQFKPGSTIEQTAEIPLAKLAPGVKEGDIISYYIEVADEYPGESGPHRVISESRRLQVLSVDDYQAYMQRQRALLLGGLRPVYRQQRVAGQTIREFEETRP